MKKTLSAVLLAAAIVGCTGQSVQEEAPKEAVKVVETTKLFEAHKDGRIYIFDNIDLYEDFLVSGHTAYMKTFIGEGPNGETLVFGLTGDQKKKLEGIPHVDTYFGKEAVEGPFYGEMHMDGRYHVFNSLEDMAATRQVGEAIYRYTDIGAGPNGETVVYVLNKGNKKKQPTELMEAFKAAHK